MYASSQLRRGGYNFLARDFAGAMAGFKITPDHGFVILSTASMCFYSILNGAVRYLPLRI